MLASPIAVTVSHKGDLYIADHRNSRIRVVDAATGIITTVAGTGDRVSVVMAVPPHKPRYPSPAMSRWTADGSLYIADGANNRIRKVDSNGTITTVVGTGRTEFSDDGDPAHKASLSMPYSIALDPAGNLLVVDTGNYRVRKNRRIDGRHHHGCRKRIIRLLRRRRPCH